MAIISRPVGNSNAEKSIFVVFLRAVKKIGELWKESVDFGKIPLDSRAVQGNFQARDFRKQKVTVKKSARYRLITAPTEQFR